MRCVMGITVILALLSGYAMAAGEDAVAGTWLTQDKDCRIEIAKNADGTFDGKIIWLEKPNYDPGDPEEGKPVHDRENPDKSKRDQPILGMKILSGFKFASDNLWKGGTIYDPKSGKTYKCKMTLTDNNTLDVRGFVGIAAFGRTETWTRYTEEKK